MSNNSPVEQQRFARTQTPESPRPVHVPEPAKIPVLLNQMDPSSNDLATYNIPTDQTFAHYGDSLENPAYKSTPSKEEADPFRDFLRNADHAVANPSPTEPHVPEKPNLNLNLNALYTNQPTISLPISDQITSDQPSTNEPAQHSDASHLARFPDLQTTLPFQAGNTTSYVTNAIMPTTTVTLPDHLAPEEQRSTLREAYNGQTMSTQVIDYQSLLDNIAKSTSTAPPFDMAAALTTESSSLGPDSGISSLPSFPGLPKKPPPLETQSTFPPSIDVAQSQQLPISVASQAVSSLQSANGYPTSPNDSSNLPSTAGADPLASANPFDSVVAQQIPVHMQYPVNDQNQSMLPDQPDEPSERPWSPKTQAIYDRFLDDERHYVTEGIWDRFPIGSRLFVGNLPSEKVTKRDMFHRFHKHGKLAQISIKQAYGFIQFHDAESCKAALDAEQGVELRGRKVHLEISKPQKATKGAPQQQNNRNQNRKRSRSPQRRSYNEFRDEPNRRRDDYRSRRSPSPRAYRRNDRASSRDDRRSPTYGSSFSTPQPAYDDESTLPYPRRDPRYVPDVQVIVLDGGVQQAFINWIEDGFKRKGLNAATTLLNQRTPLSAVVKRQIVEGVQAVVKLGSSHQTRSKIPLQVFDRSAGMSNITFNEYVDLDIPVAADVVMQARQRERSSLQPPRPQYPPTMMLPQIPYQQQSPTNPWAPPPPHNLPQYPPQPAPPTPQYQYQPQVYRPTPPQYSTPNSATSQPANLQDLLANLKGGAAPPIPQSAQSVGQPYTPYGALPPLVQHQQYPPTAFQYGGQGAQQPNGPQNVQSIMDQLARFQRP